MNKETMEFYGFTGKNDEARKQQIANQVGADNFDYDDTGREYEEYKNAEVKEMNAR